MSTVGTTVRTADHHLTTPLHTASSPRKDIWRKRCLAALLPVNVVLLTAPVASAQDADRIAALEQQVAAAQSAGDDALPIWPAQPWC